MKEMSFETTTKNSRSKQYKAGTMITMTIRHHVMATALFDV